MSNLPKWYNSSFWWVSTIILCNIFLAHCSAPPQQKEPSPKRPHKKYTEQTLLPGVWFDIPESSGNRVQEQELRNNLNSLKTLGYLSGYQPATKESGVTIYKKNAVYEGLNLVVSGHKPYAALMDMAGKTIHSWTYNYNELKTNREELIITKAVDENFKNYWRRVFLYKNGDLLAIYDYLGLIKLDKNSKLIWHYPKRAHHDIFTTDKGGIWILTTEKNLIPRLHVNKPVLEDFICELDQNGKKIFKLSILEALENSQYSRYLQKIKTESPDSLALDIFHTNSITIFDGSLKNKSPRFKKGNVLISIRELNIIAIIDISKKSVVWAIEGPWRAQHESQLLPNGNILLFDNKGGKDHSRILEIDSNSGKIVWEYTAIPPESFYSPIVGSQQRLPNGNTLITDTFGGSAFETTSSGEIVWKFINPNRAGKKNNLVAALFEVVRLGKDFPLLWLNKPSLPVNIRQHSIGR